MFWAILAGGFIGVLTQSGIVGVLVGLMVLAAPRVVGK